MQSYQSLLGLFSGSLGSKIPQADSRLNCGTFEYKNEDTQERPHDKGLTHCSLETHKRVIGKQCRPRSDTAECGV